MGADLPVSGVYDLSGGHGLFSHVEEQWSQLTNVIRKQGIENAYLMKEGELATYQKGDGVIQI
jgi:hypothetical protein